MQSRLGELEWSYAVIMDATIEDTTKQGHERETHKRGY